MLGEDHFVNIPKFISYFNLDTPQGKMMERTNDMSICGMILMPTFMSYNEPQGHRDCSKMVI